MAKVLWLGDGGCHTGFARVTHSIGDRLVTNFEHEVSVLAYNYLGDYWPTPMRLYRPTTIDSADIYGRTRIIELLAKIEPDVVVMLNDANIILQLLFDNPYDANKYLLQYRPLITYVPVDGYNLPPAWPDILTKISNVVVMSEFGQKQYPGSQLVYHGVDTERFYPVTSERPLTVSSGRTVSSKAECKEAFGFDPNSFLILRVDKNSGRKDFATSWKALVPVMKRHSDINVFFHTVWKGGNSGMTIKSLIAREPSIMDRFYSPDFHNSYMGWDESDLVALYNAADLFLSTSRGEGFGLTLAEAMACGVPVIAQNVSAIPEVVGPGGILIEPDRMITVPSGEDVWLANPGAFSEAIEHLYQAGGVRRKLGKAGREHVVTSFSWDTAASQFNDFIVALAEGVTETAVAG